MENKIRKNLFSSNAVVYIPVCCKEEDRNAELDEFLLGVDFKKVSVPLYMVKTDAFSNTTYNGVVRVGNLLDYSNGELKVLLLGKFVDAAKKIDYPVVKISADIRNGMITRLTTFLLTSNKPDDEKADELEINNPETAEEDF